MATLRGGGAFFTIENQLLKQPNLNQLRLGLSYSSRISRACL